MTVFLVVAAGAVASAAFTLLCVVRLGARKPAPLTWVETMAPSPERDAILAQRYMARRLAQLDASRPRFLLTDGK